VAAVGPGGGGRVAAGRVADHDENGGNDRQHVQEFHRVRDAAAALRHGCGRAPRTAVAALHGAAQGVLRHAGATRGGGPGGQGARVGGAGGVAQRRGPAGATRATRVAGGGGAAQSRGAPESGAVHGRDAHGGGAGGSGGAGVARGGHRVGRRRGG